MQSRARVARKRHSSKPAYEVPATDQAQATEARRELSSATPSEVLRWAMQTFGAEFCVTTSLADAVLIDMACKIQPGVHVVFVDTGYHFPETLQTRTEIAARYPITMISAQPERTVAEQDAEHGLQLFDRNPDLCCRLRKVEPINQVLKGYRAWASGIRRDETSVRSNVSTVEWDPVRSLVKVNPLANWTQPDVDAYVRANDVLVSPLVAQGYFSIGCAPCTLPAMAGGDGRSGRWVGRRKIECGLHTG